MDVIYLDQNKWIDFSKVEARKETSSEIVSLYSDLRAAVERNEVMFPLSLSHVLETSKINDFARREHLALTQSKLSKGWVIRSRKGRLVIELRCALKRAFGEQEIALSDTWMFAQGFMQAFEPFDDFVAAKTEVVRNRLFNNFQSPEALLFRFLTGQDDSNGRRGIASFSKGSDALIDRIEKRRRKIANISKEMKWRAYGALLFYDHQDLIASVLSSIGKTVDQFKQLGDETVAKLIDDVPTLNIERNLAVKLEAQSRALERNDLLDMYSMCGAIPYSKWVIAEKTFIALAKQCKLDQEYCSFLSSSLTQLAGKY